MKQINTDTGAYQTELEGLSISRRGTCLLPPYNSSLQWHSTGGIYEAFSFWSLVHLGQCCPYWLSAALQGWSFLSLEMAGTEAETFCVWSTCSGWSPVDFASSVTQNFLFNEDSESARQRTPHQLQHTSMFMLLQWKQIHTSGCQTVIRCC